MLHHTIKCVCKNYLFQDNGTAFLQSKSKESLRNLSMVLRQMGKGM